MLQLENDGWDVMYTTEVSVIPVLKSQSPLIIAQKDGAYFFISSYSSTDEAKQAYDDLVLQEDTETIEISNGYLEQSVTETSDGKHWIIRLAGQQINGLLEDNPWDQQAAETFLNGFLK